jgi:hypothetical protein
MKFSSSLKIRLSCSVYWVFGSEFYFIGRIFNQCYEMSRTDQFRPSSVVLLDGFFEIYLLVKGGARLSRLVKQFQSIKRNCLINFKVAS